MDHDPLSILSVMTVGHDNYVELIPMMLMLILQKPSHTRFIPNSSLPLTERKKDNVIECHRAITQRFAPCLT